MIGPIVIGGIGGSGTRVVAEILTCFGFYLGADLNGARDNLTFTLLFKRPAWYIRNKDNFRHLETGLRILEKTMLTGKRLSLKEKFYLKRAVRDMSKYGHNREGQGKGEWALQRLPFIKNPVIPDPAIYTGWGWKEPNSHLLIPVMNNFFPGFKYIHTVRHGLDMAYSSNQQQLFNWGPLFGVPLPVHENETPSASFRYWVEAHKRILALQKEIGRDRILILNFDRLCEDPERGIREILEFLGIQPSEELLARAAKLPVTPKTAGRWRQHPEDVFDENDLEFLRKMGFDG